MTRRSSAAAASDLSHAFTLFSESGKKANPTLRGRFNFGEKLVLAVCESATMATTKGTVEFTRTGRRTTRRRRKAGTEFRATINMTRQEIEEAVAAARGFIGPDRVVTEINGVAMPHREPLRSFEHTLQTEVADANGVLRRRKRAATLRVYEPLPGMPARLYEMGIPVTEMLDGDRWDVDVRQKVPVKRPRYHLPFTPTSASWLNLVEGWFALPTARQLRRGSCRSPRALEQAIRSYVASTNDNPKPFVWTKPADDVLASVERFCQRTSNSGH